MKIIKNDEIWKNGNLDFGKMKIVKNGKVRKK